jgi:hypothetical protein
MKIEQIGGKARHQNIENDIGLMRQRDLEAREVMKKNEKAK